MERIAKILPATIVMAIVLSISSFAQGPPGPWTEPPVLLWSLRLDHQSDQAADVFITDHRSMYVVANTIDWGTQESRILLFEVSRAGYERFRRYLGEPGARVDQILKFEEPFVFHVLGTSANDRPQIISLDTLHATQWSTDLGSASWDVNGVAMTPSDQVAVATRIVAGEGAEETSIPAVVYLTLEGDSLSTSTFDEEGYVIPKTLSTAALNGGIIMGGRRRASPTPLEAPYLLKVDNIGLREWSIVLGDEQPGGIEAVIEDPEGNYVAVGWSDSGDAQGRELYAAKISSQGEFLWDFRTGGEGDDVGYAVTTDLPKVQPDEGYVIAGTSGVAGTTDTRMYLLKLTPNGEFMWQTISEFRESYARKVMVDANGDYIVAGSSEGLFDGADALLVKYGAASTRIEDLPTEIPHGLASVRVFPNPAVASATVAYTFPEPTTSRIRIFDVLGRVVREWSVQMDTQGQMQLDLADASGRRLSSGIYLIRISGSAGEATARIVVE